MLGLTFDKLLLIGVLAAFLVGPQRLPALASKLATLIKKLRALADTAQDRVREELGDDAELLDWRKLDPGRYDPRRIIREALSDGVGTTTQAPPIVVDPVSETPHDAAGSTGPTTVAASASAPPPPQEHAA